MVSLHYCIKYLFLFKIYSFAGGECIISSRKCNNFPEFDDSVFPDAYGHEYLGTQSAAGKCMRRAEDFHHWCGNGRENERAMTAATHKPTLTSQIYHPTACDPKWSLYGKHCYIHVWQAKTWWEAEQWCNEKGASLCSIHGPAENEFVFTLTKGITSWIGYQDQDQDQKFEWTDNTPANFENMANDCAGRETDPDCAPEQQAQKWHNWAGEDRSTWVCKKLAKWRTKLVRDVESPEKLSLLDWESYKKPHVDSDTKQLSEPAKASSLEAVSRPKSESVEKNGKVESVSSERVEKKDCGDGRVC